MIGLRNVEGTDSSLMAKSTGSLFMKYALTVLLLLTTSSLPTHAGGPADERAQAAAACRVLDAWHADQPEPGARNLHIVCWTPADRELPATTLLLPVEIADRQQVIQTTFRCQSRDGKRTGGICDVANEHCPQLNQWLLRNDVALCYRLSGQPVAASAEQDLHRVRRGSCKVTHISQSLDDRRGNLCDLLFSHMSGDKRQLNI